MNLAKVMKTDLELAEKDVPEVILQSNISFKTCLTKSEACLDENLLLEDEFEAAYDSLKGLKAPGFDETLSNTFKSVSGQIRTALLLILYTSVKFGTFPEKKK